MSANFSRSLAFPVLTCLKLSKSSKYAAICRLWPPYFRSSRSFAASYAVAEWPKFSITCSASQDKYCRNCSNLYSAVAGALSMQARNAAFQLWYFRLSPWNTGICTRLSCRHKSCPMDGASRLHVCVGSNGAMCGSSPDKLVCLLVMSIFDCSYLEWLSWPVWVMWLCLSSKPPTRTFRFLRSLSVGMLFCAARAFRAWFRKYYSILQFLPRLVAVSPVVLVRWFPKCSFAQAC